MSNLVSNLGRAISRRISGERPKEKSDMVGNDANQDGATGAVAPNQNNNKDDIHHDQSANDEQSACSTCEKSWSDIKPKGSHSYLCAFCDKWSCANCAHIKKNEHAGVKRDYVFWACQTCLTSVKDLIKNDKGLIKSEQTNSDNDINAEIKSLKEKMETFESDIENKIMKAVEKTMPKVMENLSQDVNQGIQRMWSETIFGDYDEEFPNMTPATNDQSEPSKKQTKQQTKPSILHTVVQKAVTESKHDDIKREERLNNIIIHRVPESNEKNSEVRKTKENELVNTLLDTIGVEAEPQKIMRLGRYKEPTEGEQQGSRPLKVSFRDHKTQQEIMNNIKKLKDAPDTLRNLSVCYDMSQSERDILKERLKSAKEKTEQSTNWKYLVRGPPWKLEEIRVKKIKG